LSDDHVPNLRGNPIVAVLSPIVTILTIIGGAIWWAARAPDPSKFDKLQTDMFDLRMEQGLTKMRVQGIQDSVQRIEGQQSTLGVKMDQLLSRKRQAP